MENQKDGIVKIEVDKINFHPVLKDIENMFWFFLLSIRTLSDDDIQSILKTKNSQQEDYKCFNEMLNKFNSSTKLQIEKRDSVVTSKMNILEEMIFMGKSMAIITYDFLSLSSYNVAINKDIEFQFLRYIRNGAAHNNKFNFKDEKGEWKIGEDEALRWNGMEINRKLQGTKVFNDFISLFGIFLLAKHFSEKLFKIDSKKK